MLPRLGKLTGDVAGEAGTETSRGSWTAGDCGRELLEEDEREERESDADIATRGFLSKSEKKSRVRSVDCCQSWLR